MSSNENILEKEAGILTERMDQLKDKPEEVVKRLLSAYHTALTERPLATKAATSAIISALGDLLASWKSGKRNLRRTLAFFIYGGAITGPVFHYWYRMLETQFARLKGSKNILAKLFMDRFIITPPFLALTLFSLRLFENGRWREATAGARQAYMPALKTNYKVWTIAQIVNFTYVPPAYRVLFGNIVALWWSFYLSRLEQNEV